MDLSYGNRNKIEKGRFTKNSVASKPISTHCALLALTIWQRALWPQCKWDCFAASTVSGGGGMADGQTTGQAAGRLYSACAVILFCLNSKKSSKVFFEPKNLFGV